MKGQSESLRSVSNYIYTQETLETLTACSILGNIAHTLLPALLMFYKKTQSEK